MSDRIEEMHKKIEAIKKWSKRLEKLRLRKKDPLSERQFCEKYGMSVAGFNRIKNGIYIPQKANFNKIEAAFKAERV